MSFIKDYAFSAVTDYIYDSSNITLANSLATIKLIGASYTTSNVTIIVNEEIQIEGLSSFSESSIKTGSDAIRYTLSKNDTWYYYSSLSGSWIESNGTYSQTNSASQITLYARQFSHTPVATKFKAYLHSDNGTTTPSLDNVRIIYNFGGTSNPVNITTVWGYSLNSDGTPNVTEIKAYLNKAITNYSNNTLVRKTEITTIPNSITGYWELELIDNENMETGLAYYFEFCPTTRKKYKKYVPEIEFIEYNSLNSSAD
jgi:hypothetical protein